MQGLGPLRNLIEGWQVERHLACRSYMQPTLHNQQMWARRLAPDQGFDETLSVWQLLQRFTVPLIRRYASGAHVRGMALLGLDREEPPGFTEFQSSLMQHTDWIVHPCEGELAPSQFFAMLARGEFPVVREMRPLHAVFCGYQPDFWHEAVGHIAVLVDPTYSHFYRWCGQVVTNLLQGGRLRTAEQLWKILWIVLEYGFILESGEVKSFGAALSGSFMGLQRLSRGYLAFREFDPQAVLDSGLAEHSAPPPRSQDGRVQFFVAPSLNDIQMKIEQWCKTVSQSSDKRLLI